MTRQQDNNSTESSTKKYLSLLESKHLSERDGTLQCSAGPEWYGCRGTIRTLASTWALAVGRPSESAGTSQHAKRKLGRSSGITTPESFQFVGDFHLLVTNVLSYFWVPGFTGRKSKPRQKGKCSCHGRLLRARHTQASGEEMAFQYLGASIELTVTSVIDQYLTAQGLPKLKASPCWGALRAQEAA